MTKQLKWRLGKLPTPDEVLKLVNDKLITKEEAREILFNEEEITERTPESLESEIKFLRELVEKLSKQDSTRVVEIIKEIRVPYYQYQWTAPYATWCESITTTPLLGGLCGGGSGNVQLCSATVASGQNFSDIQTF